MSELTAPAIGIKRPRGTMAAVAWRRDMATAVLGLWVVGAVYADGWAHLNVPGLESFFTPWHGALYAGLAVFAGWLGLIAWRGRRSAGSLLAGLPVGYRGAAAGVAMFGAGGVADMVWHQIFGVEAGVDALLSPSHLVLLAGGTLMVSTGWRAQRAASADRATLPELLSLATAAALAAFFLSYTSAFTQATPTTVFVNLPEGAPGHLEAELPVVAALASYLVTTAVFAVALLATVRAGRRHPATLTLLVGLVAGLSVAMVDLPGVAVAGAVGAVGGAVAADVVLARLRPEQSHGRVAGPASAAVAALLVWSGQLVGFAVYDGVRWPVELWSGVVFLAGLAAAALAVPSMVTGLDRRRSR